jgi:aldehyde dehydrogenase (NAD+)
LAKVKETYAPFVDGHWGIDEGSEQLTVTNPASGMDITVVTQATRGQVDKAVKSAHRAKDRAWSKLPASERGKYLFRVARLIAERSRELAVLETLQTGRSIKETRDGDLPAVAQTFFYYAGWADKLDYAGLGVSPKSVGVVAAVIDYTAPLLNAARVIAPALAAGNTVVVKPSELTPLSTLALAEILQQAEIPAGVVNILPGDKAIGATLVAHPEVAAIAVIGSTSVGKHVQKAIAGTGKRLVLELSGKSTTIVAEDAPIDQAVDGIITGAFANAGQGNSANRVLVAEPIAEQVISALKSRLAALRVGDPLDANTDIGALRKLASIELLTDATKQAESEGVQRFVNEFPLPDKGNYFPPTIFHEVGQAHSIASADIAGPIVSVLTFRLPDEAVTKSNNTPGTSAVSVWTHSGSLALWFAKKLRTGTVWANSTLVSDPAASTGGFGESGIGRLGGAAALAAFVEV